MHSKIACTNKFQGHHCDISHKSFKKLFEHSPLKKLVCPRTL